MSDAAASLLSSILLLLYWEIRARAARARQDALAEEVRRIPEDAARQALAVTPPADSDPS